MSLNSPTNATIDILSTSPRHPSPLSQSSGLTLAFQQDKDIVLLDRSLSLTSASKVHYFDVSNNGTRLILDEFDSDLGHPTS